jgi:uncharacterized protein with NRDE domain
MCLIAFAWGASERFPFVIAANRDEFLARPTSPLSQWTSPGGATVIAGRDRQDGGTWMGFSPNGHFAMLTNVRDPQAAPPAAPISRGGLPLAWLESDLKPQAWADTLDGARYQGFNLIVGDWHAKQCHYLTNSSKNMLLQEGYKVLKPIADVVSTKFAMNLVVNEMPWGAIYGLSNAALDTPWPKTQLLKTALQSSLACTDTELLVQHNLQALAQRDKPADGDLPKTGVPLELERALSSAFVMHPQTAPHYGTRTSLVAVYESNQGLRLTEITHSQEGCASKSASAQLNWH